MKKKLSVFILLFSIISNSQTPIKIGVEKNFLSILIFDEEIDYDLTDLGNTKNFMIIPNQNNNKILKIKCLDDKEVKKTNLFVLTKENTVYDFLLSVEENPKQRIHYIKNDRSKRINTISKKNDELNLIEKPYSYYSDNIKTDEQNIISNKSTENVLDKVLIEDICKKILSNKKRIFKVYGKSGKVILTLKDLVYRDNVLYFLLSLKNNGKIKYDIDFLNFYTGVNHSDSTIQNNEIKVLYKHKEPTKVIGGDTSDFVIALEKFTLNKNKYLFINLGENEGERDIDLIVNNQIINNPNNLKK